MSEQPANSIRLDQFLKVQGVVATGGQAKMMIQGGEVKVNGEVETRRGRKLNVGDVVCLEDLRLLVELHEEQE
jgi:ribosome-associated protein